MANLLEELHGYLEELVIEKNTFRRNRVRRTSFRRKEIVLEEIGDDNTETG